MKHTTHDDTVDVNATFSTDVEGLPDASRPEVVELDDGATHDLRIHAVAKDLGYDYVAISEALKR